MSTKEQQRVSRRRGLDLARAGGALACLLLLITACGAASGPNGVASPSPAAVEAGEAWRRERPAPGPARSFDYPPAEVARLDNGVQLYLVPRKSGTVALSISARAGGAACGPGESGLAALTLRLMTEATRQKEGLALAKAVEALGTSLGFDTGRDASSLSLEVLPSDVEPALELLAEVITQPRFAADDVARVKKQWLDSLVSERQEPSRLSSLAGMRALLGTTAGAPVGGTLADVERLTQADLSRFHKRQYVSGNLAVIAVGDLSMEALKELAQKSLGKLPPGTPPPLPALELPPPPAQTAIWLIDRPGSVQSALFVGQPFPERSAQGYEARQVMNNLLGGLFTSRLNLNLREKHAYTYGVRSMAIATRRWGAFISMSSIKTENTADALEQLTLELEGLRRGNPNPITNDELERSKTDLVHQLGASLEHVRRVLSDTGELYVDELPADYHHTYPARIRAVEQATALAEAQRLEPRRLVVVIVGDATQVRPLLEAKGLSAVAAPASFTD
jgi:zinc protease